MDLKIGDNPIEVEGQLEFVDYLLANYWYLVRRFWLLLGSLLVVAVTWPVIQFGGVFGETLRPPGHGIWAVLFAPGILALLVIGTYFGARRHYQSNRAISQRLRFAFSSTGIGVAGPLSSGHASWETIRNAYENRRSFLLFPSNNQMYIIPKRYFGTEGQIAQFRHLLKGSLGERAKIREVA